MCARGSTKVTMHRSRTCLKARCSLPPLDMFKTVCFQECMLRASDIHHSCKAMPRGRQWGHACMHACKAVNCRKSSHNTWKLLLTCNHRAGQQLSLTLTMHMHIYRCCKHVHTGMSQDWNGRTWWRDRMLASLNIGTLSSSATPELSKFQTSGS